MNTINNEFRIKAGYYDKGILAKKGVYFHSPSDFVQKNLLYPSWGAEILCTAPYQIHRKTHSQYMDAYLIFRIMDGKLYFDYENVTFTAASGELVLLDSHIPNHYWAADKVRFQYIHFNGPLSKTFYELIHTNQKIHSTGRTESAFLFNNILKEMSDRNPNDLRLSLWMYNLIAGITLPDSSNADKNVVRARQYMQDNFSKAITVDDIARYAGLSRFHFSRIFKQETGFTPHQYLINIRLKHAQEILAAGPASLDDIAISCGFSSTSHFIHTFKKKNGVTPTMFRKYFDASGFEGNADRY